MLCARCKKETKTFTCSWFNTDEICMNCAAIESKHPLYKSAKKVENEAVKKGNFNFEGVGLPEDFEEFVKGGQVICQ